MWSKRQLRISTRAQRFSCSSQKESRKIFLLASGGRTWSRSSWTSSVTTPGCSRPRTRRSSNGTSRLSERMSTSSSTIRKLSSSTPGVWDSGETPTSGKENVSAIRATDDNKGLTESHYRDDFRYILRLLKVPGSVKYSSCTTLIQNLPCKPVELLLDLFVAHWILWMPLVIVNLFRHNLSRRKLYRDSVRHRFWIH